MTFVELASYVNARSRQNCQIYWVPPLGITWQLDKYGITDFLSNYVKHPQFDNFHQEVILLQPVNWSITTCMSLQDQGKTETGNRLRGGCWLLPNLDKHPPRNTTNEFQLERTIYPVLVCTHNQAHDLIHVL